MVRSRICWSASCRAQRQDWREAVAGQRVQIIKPDPNRTGVLEFGTELISGADIDLTKDAAATRDTRAKTAAVLGLTNV
jgi:malate dehydrogenase (quinone)